jgi:hypothetical protein
MTLIRLLENVFLIPAGEHSVDSCFVSLLRNDEKKDIISFSL